MRSPRRPGRLDPRGPAVNRQSRGIVERRRILAIDHVVFRPVVAARVRAARLPAHRRAIRFHLDQPHRFRQHRFRPHRCWVAVVDGLQHRLLRKVERPEPNPRICRHRREHPSQRHRRRPGLVASGPLASEQRPQPHPIVLARHRVEVVVQHDLQLVRRRRRLCAEERLHDPQVDANRIAAETRAAHLHVGRSSRHKIAICAARTAAGVEAVSASSSSRICCSRAPPVSGSFIVQVLVLTRHQPPGQPRSIMAAPCGLSIRRPPLLDLHLPQGRSTEHQRVIGIGERRQHRAGTPRWIAVLPEHIAVQPQPHVGSTQNSSGSGASKSSLVKMLAACSPSTRPPFGTAVSDVDPRACAGCAAPPPPPTTLQIQHPMCNMQA